MTNEQRTELQQQTDKLIAELFARHESEAAALLGTWMLEAAILRAKLRHLESVIVEVKP